MRIRSGSNLIIWELPNGSLHRVDGPAVYNKDHSIEEWYLNGKLHREDGPAKIRRMLGNYEEWYLNGQTHRTDGPAITFSDGRVAYAIKGVHMSLEDFAKEYLITHLKVYTAPDGINVLCP